MDKFLPADKLVHALIGFVLFTASCLAMFFLGPAASAPLWVRLFTSPVVALSTVRVAAWGKEAYDEAHPATHTKDALDAEVTLVGAHIGLIGYIFLVLFTL